MIRKSAAEPKQLTDLTPFLFSYLVNANMVFFKKPRRRYCYGQIKDFIFQLYKGNSKQKITLEVQFWWKSPFWIFANKIHILTSKVHILIQIQLAHHKPCLMITVFENHRKSLIQHCESTFTFWMAKSS